MTAVETGYREGKFAFVDVIAAQRTLLEASTLLVDSLEEYALARTEIERLIGAPTTGGLRCRTEGMTMRNLTIEAYRSKVDVVALWLLGVGPAVAPRRSSPPNTERRMDMLKAS